MEYKYLLSQFDFNVEDITKFYGYENKHIKLIEDNFKCAIKGNSEILTITLVIDNKKEIDEVLNSIVAKIQNNQELDDRVVLEIINRVKTHQEEISENVKYVTTYNGKVIRPKNQSQLKYYKLLENNTIIFAMGAAGTGKTYLAVAYGVSMLKIKKVSNQITELYKSACDVSEFVKADFDKTKENSLEIERIKAEESFFCF